MKCIALYSIKGGVGKTAACVNLAHLAAVRQGPVLLCDLDSQAASGFYYRIRPKSKYNSRKLLKGGKWIEKAIRGTDFENLDLLPADLSYRHLDLQLKDAKGSRTRLRQLIAPLGKTYPLVFFDCPPSLSLISENVFTAADAVLVPLVPTTLSLRTYHKLETFFETEGFDRQKIYPFFSMVESRKPMHLQRIRQTIQDGLKPLKTYIPYNVEVEKMGIYRAPLTHSQPGTGAALAFARLWAEIETTVLKGPCDER